MHPASPEPDPETLPLPRGTETVLVADDDEQVRRFVRMALEPLGYLVLTCEDGVEAVDACIGSTGEVRLLLTDVVMPMMSGRELAEQLQGRYPGLGVLYLSGYDEEDVWRYGVETREAAFLRKPFTPARLARKVLDRAR